MEFNGPANIKMALQMLSIDGNATLDDLKENIEKTIKMIDSEADMIMNYLKEINSILKENGLEEKIPYWHEVKAKYRK